MIIKIHFNDGNVIVTKNPISTDFDQTDKVVIEIDGRAFSYGKEKIDFILISEVSK